MTGHDAGSGILVAAIESTELNGEERAFFRDERPAGVTLFKRNIPSTYSDARQLCDEIQSLVASPGLPAVVAIDQEGGRVSRIGPPFPNLGPALELANGSADPRSLKVICDYGETVGCSLLEMGINVNFAPVCDVITNPKNIAIGDRAFSSEPEKAAQRAGSYLAGLQKAGVLGCLKHFPGQGDAGEDTHLSGTVLNLELPVLEGRELVPFKALMQQAPMVMISHGIYPFLDRDTPASLSSRIMNDLLRHDLGFEGVVVTDDMNMKAIPQDQHEWAQAIVTAVRQGADMVLVCQGLDRCRLALEALRSEAGKSPSFARRLEDAAGRVRTLRGRLKPATPLA